MSSTSRTRENPRDFDRKARDDRSNERSVGTTAARKEPAKNGDNDTDEFYDEVVRGGPGDQDEDEDDAYEQLTRVNVRDMGEAVVEDLDEDVSEQDVDAERPLRPYNLADEDDGGSVSPEELGEQFLRGAAQQERRVARNDAESPADVDLLSDSAHQVSLFDHNQDPLGEPHLPQVVADETQADADHRPGERSTSKRAALHAAEDRGPAPGANKPDATKKRSTNKPTESNKPATSKPATGASQKRAATSKPKAKAGGTNAGRATSKTAARKTSKVESEPSDKARTQKPKTTSKAKRASR
jgi:hypothetical protein